MSMASLADVIDGEQKCTDDHCDETRSVKDSWERRMAVESYVEEVERRLKKLESKK